MTVLKDFQKFLMRGNLVDLAVGFTVGASFSTLAKSLVDDMIMPPIAALMGNQDFNDLFLVLKKGGGTLPYETLSEAQSAGAITLNYGRFLSNLLALVLVGFAMFLVIKFVNQIDDRLEGLIGKKKNKTDEEPANKKCPYCHSTIAYKATRCPQCTSKLETT